MVFVKVIIDLFIIFLSVKFKFEVFIIIISFIQGEFSLMINPPVNFF